MLVQSVSLDSLVRNQLFSGHLTEEHVLAEPNAAEDRCAPVW